MFRAIHLVMGCCNKTVEQKYFTEPVTLKMSNNSDTPAECYVMFSICGCSVQVGVVEKLTGVA